ncbi:MAG TPA: thrombospondin type 3 repeat-containing protein [Candidatus Acidoferrum sp.]|nr:thrombospondin type 3 repeat-containing protein [Candidatus Acidoferrum sp.]
MLTRTRLLSTVTLLLGLCLSCGTAARAGCPIDFEDLPLGTAVTNQYLGVTFSVLPQTCSGSPALYMRIANSSGGTSSGTKCLKIDTGCPDFSDDYLRMVFANPQTSVSFVLGDDGVPYTIRYYNTTSSGGLIGSFIVNTSSGVHTLVTVTGVNILRIEVQSVTGGYYEAIDDLTFDADLTPPIAEITSPAYQACDCNDNVNVYGRSCEDNGVFDHDTLYYMPVGGSTWTFVGSYSTPACSPNSLLYTWNSTGLPEGLYYLKLTTYNKCGLSSEAVTVVSVDRTISAAMRQPATPMIVGGTNCIDGSVSDGCFAYYTVERSVPNTSTYVPVDGAHPQYSIPVINDPLATWNTTTNSDGEYKVRLTAFDLCGHGSTPQEVKVTVDNTPPVANISSPVQCSKMNGLVPVFGTASDANLQSWVLQYSSANSHSWVTITSGSSSVVNGLLANWDTTGLPQCAYTLRLVATDQSRVNLDCSGSSGANQSEYLLDLDVVSDPLAQDSDGDGMPDAWEVAHGFNPYDPSDALQDADNDGQSNLAEYLAGTDPHDPHSLLRITSIAREGADTRVAWTTVGSHNYLLQGGTNITTGIHSNVSPLISIPPGGSSTTNYLHVNGATLPEGFYRVRLAP